MVQNDPVSSAVKDVFELKDIGVKVTYRNDKLEPVYEKSYSLREYVEMIRADLLRIITDVENMAYRANGNKPKDEWSDESWSEFCRTKHKLLDKAGDIGRLPDNIFEYSNNNLSEFVASVLNKGAV